MGAGTVKNEPPRVLYGSTLMSAETFSALFSHATVRPSLAAQKYHGLMTRGFAQNGISITALSAPPVSRQTSRRRFVRVRDEKKDGVSFHYLPVVAVPGLKHVLVAAGAFWYTLTRLKRSDFAVCDGLNIALSAGVGAACRLRRRPCAAIVTDVPDILAGGRTRTSKANTRLLARFDGYILLTEAMNPLVNPRGKPFLVAEGQVDATMSDTANELAGKHPEKVCLYAGMLHEKYGMVRLAEAFRMVKDESARLVLYGDGDAADRIRKLAGTDGRIEYRGVADNRTVVQEELKATLLINPRPSNEDFTAYSFPSKNLEYMVSGTPVLTTKLPGMPREYDRYAYLFNDESTEGMAKTLNAVLGLPREELHELGGRAKAFALKNKSNTAQARRVMDFLKMLERNGTLRKRK